MIRGTLLAALSGILFGFLGFLGMRLLDMNFSIENMLFWRFFIAFLFILILLRPFKRKLVFNLGKNTSLIKTLILGAFCYSGSSSFYFLASEYIGTGPSMVIFYLFPVFIMLFAWLFDKVKPGKYTIFSLAAVLIGLVLLHKQQDGTLDIIGIILAVISAVFYAVFVYSSKDQSKGIDAQLLTFLVCIGNMLTFLVWSLITNTLFIPTSLTAWFYIIALGIVATALPIRLFLISLKYITPVKASLLSVLEPIVTVIIGCLLLAEIISPLQFMGIIVILLGAILIQFEAQTSTTTD